MSKELQLLNYRKEIEILNSEIKELKELKRVDHYLYEEVIEKYNKRIEHLKSRIGEIEKENLINSDLTMLKKFLWPALLILFFVGILFLRPTIIGYVTELNSVKYSIDVNQTFTHSDNYLFHISKKGLLTSLKISGDVIGQGSVQVYIEKNGIKYIVLDSNAIKDKGVPIITGFATEEDEDKEKNESFEIPINETPILNETIINITQPINKSIAINLEYKKDSIYDGDNDGIENITNAIDLTVENTQFNWDADESMLCTRWEVYNINEDKATTLCYGNNECCNLINLESSRENWNEIFYGVYGQDGVGLNNVISSQVIYANYSLNVDNPYADIVYSEWTNLSTAYNYEKIVFNNICKDTCFLENFNESSYTLIIETENVTLQLDEILYSLLPKIDKYKLKVNIVDKYGQMSPIVSVYKDNNFVTSTEKGSLELASDIYDIDVALQNEPIEKITLNDVELRTDSEKNIIFDEIKNNISLEGIEIMKKYAIDSSLIDNAIITATASGNSLFKCKDWNYELEVCLGKWEKTMDLTVGEQYNISISKEDPAFVEGNIEAIVTPSLKSNKKDFKLGEDIELDFEYLTKQELIEHGKWKEEFEVYEEDTTETEEKLELLREKIEEEEKLLTKEEKATKKQKKKFIKESESIETFVYDDEGNLKDIEIEIEELREGRFDIKLPKQRAFKAGKYTIKLELIKDGITYTQEQDFTWGVLAINVNKSIYLPNEDSFIGIAVLDDGGHMVCDADVTLEITNPLNQKTILTTTNNEIKISPECETLGVTLLPDYYADYKVSGVGDYIMNLTAVTSNGARSIEDNFIVASSVEFDVARKGPTRIYPPVPYTMNISIIANKNYNGVINEYVPAGFDISNVEIYEVSESEVTLSATENVEIIGEDLITKIEKEENGFRGILTLASQNGAQWIEHLSDSREYDSYFTHNYINVSDETDAYVVDRARSLMDKAPFWLRGRCGFDNGSENPPRSHLYVNVNNEKNERKQTRSLDKTPVWLRGISHEFAFDSEIAESHTLRSNEHIKYINVSNFDFNNNYLINNKNNIENDINENVINNIADFFTLIPSAQAQQDTMQQNNMQNNIAITTLNDTKIISIPANLKKGKKYIVSYKFDAPDISPEFYLLGPLDIGNWKEARQWQIASDAVSIVDDGTMVTNVTNPGVTITEGDRFNVTVQVDSSGGGAGAAGEIELQEGINTTLATDESATEITATCGNFKIINVINKCNDAQITCTTPGVNAWEADLAASGISADQLIIFTVEVCTGVTPGRYDIGAEENTGDTGMTIDDFVESVRVVVLDITPPVVNTSINNSAPNKNDIVNITANATDAGGLDTCNFYMNGTSDGKFIILNKTFSGAPTTGQCSQNFTIDLSAGNVINFSVVVNDTSIDTAGGNKKLNDTIITVVDTRAPIVNGSLNKSSTTIFINDIINATFNTTDETGLSFGQVVINDTGSNRFFNFSLGAGNTNAQFSQNFTISCDFGCIINITGRANDTSNNFRQNETVFTVGEQIPPNVTSISPENNAINTTHREIVFKYSVKDQSAISSCSLEINAKVNNTVNSPAKETTNIITGGNFSNADYNWSVSCSDTAGNANSSLNRTISIQFLNETKGIISTTIGATPFFARSSNPNSSCTALINGDNCIVKWRVNASGGLNERYVFFAFANATNYSANVYHNETIRINITIVSEAPQAGPDTTLPVVNTALNKSLTNILNGDVINITANVTDNVGLSFCQIIINQSGPTAIQIINISLSGASGQCSNSSPVTLAAGNVINYTIRVNDTSNNFKTNDTIITVASAITDTTPPGVNTTNINGTTNIRINDVLNISCQAFDSPTVGNITFNLTGNLDLYNFSFALTGTSANFSQNITMNATRSSAINATCWAYDSSGNGAQNSTLITVANTPPPQVTLIAPKTSNQTINRTPTFAWNNVTDADNDSLLFNVLIICVECSSDNRDSNTTNLNFTPSELLNLGDENFKYNWSVRAIDNLSSETSFGAFSEIRNITINSFVSLSLPTSTVDFGSALGLGGNDNTTDDTPAPLVLDNDGNVFENVSVYAEDDLWESVANPTNKFQFKIANVTAELFSFNWTASTTGFTNLPTAAAVAIVDLNYSDNTDSAEVDIHIEVPTDESSGAKQSKVVFEAKRSR